MGMGQKDNYETNENAFPSKSEKEELHELRDVPSRAFRHPDREVNSLMPVPL